MSIYTELKTWQSGIAAMIAFVALLVSAWANFCLNRRRDARLRKEKVQSICTALYSEILLMREEIALLARAVAFMEYHNQNFDPQFAEDYKLRDPILYVALAPKLGILSQNMALEITRFYRNYQEANESLRLILRRPGSDVSFSPVVVLEPAVAAIYDVKSTLHKIEFLAGIPAAKDPDVGYAVDFLENWKLQSEFNS